MQWRLLHQEQRSCLEQRADWAVYLAAHIAETHDAELLLVTVVESPDLLGSPERWSDQLSLARRLSMLNREMAEQHLRDLVGWLDDGVRVRTLVVGGEEAATGVREVGRDEECSLVVLSAHGRHPETGASYGPVARALLEQSELPVLVFQRLRASVGAEISDDDRPRQRSVSK